MPQIKRKSIFSVLILCICICSACNNDSESSFAEVVELGEDFNQSITLEIVDKVEGVDLNSEVFSIAKIINNSENQIWFPYDHNLRMFMFIDEASEWVESDNLMSYAPQKPQILKAGENSSIVFIPTLPTDIDIKKIRVYIEGKNMQNGQLSENTVSAFIDMSIKR